MDYNYKETKTMFDKLLTEVISKPIQVDKIYGFSLNQDIEITKIAFMIFCMEPILTLNSKRYQSLLQFFILSCYKKWKYNDSNHDNENTAFKYAYNNLDLNNEEKENLNELMNKTTFQKNDLIYFFGKIEVTSDWKTLESPIKIHSKPEILENGYSLGINLQGFIPNNIYNTLNNFSNVISNKIENLTKKEPTISDFLKEKNPSQLCFDFLSEKELTQKEKYYKILNFYLFFLKEKKLNINKNELEDIINYHFNEKFKNKNIEITYDTEKLFEHYIPKSMDLIYLLNNSQNEESLKSIKMIQTFCEKINNFYLDFIKNEMNIFNRFLETKVNKIN